MFLDYYEAFDKVLHDGSLYKLLEYGLDNKFSRMIKYL